MNEQKLYRPRVLVTAAVPPAPNRCIWCLRESPAVSFDASHVLPECVGNERQQVLPPGIVCKTCNNYFGTKVEPALLADPVFHVQAVFLRLVDPGDMNEFRDKVFDAEHPSAKTPERAMNLAVNIRGDTREIAMDVDYAVRGRLVRTYSVKDLAFLSRAIHKIAFEALAWAVFVQGLDAPPDLFSSQFNAVRAWAREGQPLSQVRPVIRQHSGEVHPTFSQGIVGYGDYIGVEMDLFGDWYATSLTSKPEEAFDRLRAYVAQGVENRWCISDTLLKW